MPELPEVESIRRSLDGVVCGRRVASVEVRDGRLRVPVGDDLVRALVGRRIVSTSRRGKYLLLHLDDGRAWFFHMGMSGRLVFTGDRVQARTHDHVVAGLSGGGSLVFHDPRRFGLTLVDDPAASRLLAGMGPEPLDADAFDAAHLESWRRRTTRSAKDVLMDQRVVAGLGNIYVNEILFRAGVRPRRSFARVTRNECRALAEATRVVIADAVAAGGSTISDFLDGTGHPGAYQASHLVYDRGGCPCTRCATPIRSVVVSQRSSFYCPRCQR